MRISLDRLRVWVVRLLGSALLVTVVIGCEDLEEGSGNVCGNLRVSDITVPGGLTPGESFEVDWTAHFSPLAGESVVASTSGEYYTWVDLFFDDQGSATESTGVSFSKRVSSLAMGGSRVDSVSFAGLPEGNYSARVYLDVLWEANECEGKRANNRDSLPFTVEFGIAPPPE